MNDDLEPNAPADEPADPVVADLLSAEKPLPPQEFQGALARRLSAHNPGWGPRPERLWPQSVVLICVGVALLLIGALVTVGGI